MKIKDLDKTPVEELILKVKNGNESFLRELYEISRVKFIAWFQKNHRLDKSEAVDLFQKTFTIFYYNVKDEKITTLNSAVPTYLIGIGKNLVKEKYKMRIDSSLENIPEVKIADYSIFKEEEETHMQATIRKILEKLEEPCKSILSLYYFRNFSMESIANNLGYKNEAVVKKKKCLCLKKIRENLSAVKTIS